MLQFKALNTSKTSKECQEKKEKNGKHLLFVRIGFPRCPALLLGLKVAPDEVYHQNRQSLVNQKSSIKKTYHHFQAAFRLVDQLRVQTRGETVASWLKDVNLSERLALSFFNLQ